MKAQPTPCATLCNTGSSKPKKRAVQYLEAAYESLSPEEQHDIARDLYGTDDPIDESQEFVDKKVKELLEELKSMKGKKTHAYKKAMDRAAGRNNGGTNDNYINCRKFYLMFLRAERFNIPKAANRLVKNFQEKLEIFGYEKLDSKINQSDLNDQDIGTLRRGAISTGATDKAGRPIVFVRRQQMLYEPCPTSMKRAVFYLLQNAAEDNEEAQKKGWVVIVHNINPPGKPQRMRHTSQITRFFSFRKMCFYALPGRVAAIHHCYNDLSFHFYLNLGLMIMPKSILPRMQCHYGTNVDCMCELLAYGINVDKLPITLDGDFQEEVVRDYLEWRRSLEDERLHQPHESECVSDESCALQLSNKITSSFKL